MKRIICFTVLFFTCISIFAQPDLAISPGFVKEIPVSMNKGRQFRFEMAVQTLQNISTVSLELYVRTNTDELIKVPNQSDLRSEQEWTIIGIGGEAEEEIKTIYIVARIRERGNYFFDDMNLYIEETNLRWKQENIPNNSFEESQENGSGIVFSSRTTSQSSYSFSEEISKVGRRSLKIEVKK